MWAPSTASIPESGWLTYEISPCSVLTELDWIASVFHNGSTFMMFSQKGDRERSKSPNLHAGCSESSSWAAVLFIEWCAPHVQQKIHLKAAYWNLTGSATSFKPPSNPIVRVRHSLLAPIYAYLAQLHTCRWSVSGLTRQELIKPTVCCCYGDIWMNCRPNETGVRRVHAHKRPIRRVKWQIVEPKERVAEVTCFSAPRFFGVRGSSFKSLKCACVKPKPPLRQARRHRAAVCA